MEVKFSLSSRSVSLRSRNVTQVSRDFEAQEIVSRIRWVRGAKVLLDSDLSELYGVATKRLNEQVRRNPVRFPSDFVFQLTDQELGRLRSQFATSNTAVGRGGRRYRPYAFTEHGSLMAANVLKLEALERRTEALALKHDALAEETRAQFKEVIEALRRLMSPSVPSRRPIGFVTP
jgi:hypothetical protein